MAAGTPVVSSRVGAEGIDYMAGVDILITDTAAEMAEAIGGLLCNSQAAYQMGQAGRRLVEAKYTWAQSAAIMLAEMDAVLGEHTPDIQDPGIMRGRGRHDSGK
jgi:glycosyltransferase involved in cell wall biosynthesis